MRIAIIGAGLTGLSCALQLKEYMDVVVFERDSVGGLVSCYCTDRYCIEKFYHHCFKNDKALIELIKNLGLSNKLVWRVVRVAYAIDGKIYPLNTPLEILRYPHISLIDKIKLAIFTLRSKRRDYRKMDNVGVIEGIKEELGEDLLKFFLPLLKAKFGEYYKDVSYAWLLARVAIRSNRTLKGELLGYLRHGFHQLIRKMEEEVDIRKFNNKFEKLNGKYIVNGEKFDALVYTGPIPELDRSLRLVAGLPEVKYQSSICALISSEDSITEDIYWTNVDEAIFGAIIEHTHFMPFEDYGEHIIYLASYSTPDGWLFNLDNKSLVKLYIKEIEKFGLKRESINWIKIFKAKYSGPIYEKGYLSKVTPYKTKLNGFYVAGMTSPPNYPERSMNGCVLAGMEVANVIKKDFGFT